MCVIRDNKRPLHKITDAADMFQKGEIIGYYLLMAAVLLSFSSLLLMLDVYQAEAAVIEPPIRSIAQVSVDDDGNDLNYPSYVFFDPVVEEIYLINGGSNRVIVYGPDFFPRMSIGNGRGVMAPQGGTVLDNGEVYICQAKSYRNKRPRITILNGAFFVEREIFLDEIPEAADYTPRQVAISRDGLIYLTGTNNRGVLVLDSDGNFLRKLEPMDQVIIREESSQEKMQQDGEEGKNEEEDLYSHIPDEFRPRTYDQDASAGPREVYGPVKIINVTIDSKGNLYLLSLETGKIYVYGPDESFLFSFGTKGGSPRQLSQPKSLAIDEEQGLIYVADYMRHTILTYDMTGRYLFEFGGRGYGPGYFNFPSSITLNSQGQLVVADLFNKRFQVLEVGYKEISIYLESASGIDSGVSNEIQSPEQEETAPERNEDNLDREDESKSSLEQMYQTIKEERGGEESTDKEEDTKFEEEIFKESHTDLPGPPSQYDEPLDTPN